MAEKDEACREVVSNVDGAVACAIVDLGSGALIGFHAVRAAPALEATLASATLALLRRNGASSAGPVLEAHVMSEHGYHFARVLAGGRAAVMLVTRRVASVGMGSAQIKAVVQRVGPEEA